MSVDEIRWAPWIDDMDRIRDSMSENLKILQNDKTDNKAVDVMKMELHSIKGLLDSVGFKFSTETIVAIEENIYDQSEVSAELLSQLQKSFDKMTELVNLVREQKPKPDQINEIDRSLGFESILIKLGADFEIEVNFKVEKSMRSARALGVVNLVKRIGRLKSSSPPEEDLYLDAKFDTLEIILSTRETDDAVYDALIKLPGVSEVTVKRKEKSDEKLQSTADSLTLKIPLTQVRQLENGLATLSGQVEILKSEITTTRGFEEMAGLDRTIERMKNDIKKLRKVPFDSISGQLAAMTSRLAAKQRKQVDLIIQGRFVTIDRAIANYLIDPITQIIRNSVIHGIEKLPQRRKAKKDIVGRILLSAVNERDKIKIKITDDGAGIDENKLMDRAKDNNIPIDQLLTQEDRLNLIFERGFSLSETEKSVAGYGIGLFAAKERLAQFGGTINVLSEPGKGTSFEIEFTDQDALSKNLIVSVNNEMFGISSSDVEQVILLQSDEITPFGDDRATCTYEGKDLPIVVLKNLLSEHKDPVVNGGINLIIIVRGRKSLIGILVDNLIDERLVNVKPLNPILQSYELFSGTLIGRDKEVILVVNPSAIA